ncbi:rap guanine nucleotide exchange factor 1-like, partial [Etheostoma cragini]|uniref:rap guanine nucleotide exchange factor 1-like n=1 Tax=Etheostoma cragini TaxID=417921 RepID=UPI00155E5378
MLQGVAHGNKESTASVTMVIRAVLDSVKELVRLAAERQGDSAPLSPVQSQADAGQTGLSDMSSAVPAEDSAPPKPPMPFSETLSQPSLPQPSLPQPSVLQPSLPQPSLPQPSVLQLSLPQPSLLEGL